MTPAERRAAARAIIDAAAVEFELTRDEVLARDRRKYRTAARKWAAWKMRELGMSPSEIGPALRRDRTTVIYYLECVEDEREQEIAKRARQEAAREVPGREAADGGSDRP